MLFIFYNMYDVLVLFGKFEGYQHLNLAYDVVCQICLINLYCIRRYKNQLTISFKVMCCVYDTLLRTFQTMFVNGTVVCVRVIFQSNTKRVPLSCMHVLIKRI